MAEPKKNYRFAKLLLALDKAAIVGFLRDSKKALAMAGVRFRRDNVPSDPEEILSMLSTLPERAQVLFNSWLKRQPGATAEGLGEAVAHIREVEKGGISEASRRQALTILIAATTSPVPAAVREFLEEDLSPKPEPPAPSALSAPAVVPAPVEPEIEEIDENRDEVLAWCKTIMPGGNAAFGEAVAIRRAGKWHQIDQVGRRRKLFPQSGDIYIPKPRSERLPAHGDFGIWRVHRQQEEGHKTEFRALGEQGLAYIVNAVPASAQNPDAVRDWLREHGSREAGARILYRLADGLLLRFRVPPQWTTYDFAEPIDCWPVLPVIRTGHLEVVPGPLPEPESKFDCADIAATVKKVVQQAHSLSTFPKFSRNEVQELGRHFKEVADPAVSEQRIRRVMVALGQVVNQQELMELLVGEILGRPEVKAALDEHLRNAEKAHLAKKGSLVEELDRLETKKKELQKHNEGLKARSDEAAQRIARAARRAFERAVKDGEDSLGQVALFAALLGRNIATQPAGASPAEVEVVEWEEIRRTDRSVEDVLAANGAGRRSAPHLAQAIAAASAAGLAIGVKGRGAAVVAANVMAAMCDGPAVAINAYPGLVEPDLIRRVMAIEGLDALCIRRANTAASESYAANLEDLLWSRLLGEEVNARPRVFLSVTDGVSTLPLSQTFSSLTFFVDLDKPYPAADAGLTRENWEAEMREHFKSAAQGGGLIVRALNRVAGQLPPSISAEALTILRECLADALRPPTPRN